MNKIKLAILFTVFIDIIGIGIVIPVLPFYVESFGARPMTVTLLFSVFALCSLVSAPFLGSLSDRIGRRPVLLASILSTSLGWFVFAAAPSVLWLFVGRIIDGMAAGNFTTAQSYLVDIAKDQKERTTNLGLIGAAFGIGFIIGPFLGGLLTSVSTTFPFYFVGVLALVNVIVAYFLLPETNKNGDRTKKIEYNPLRLIGRAIRNETLRPDFGIWFLFALSTSTMQSVFALYVGSIFGFSAFSAGLLYAMFGLILAFNQAVALKRFWLKYFKETDLQYWLMVICVLGYLLAGIKIFALFLVGQIVLAFSQSVLRVVITSQVVSNVAQPSQGEVMGILTSIVSLAMIIGPVVAGALYEKQPSWPFFLAAFFSAGAASLVYRGRRKLLKLKPIQDEITSV